jgi:uncharacterized membrane protein YfcA
MDDTDHYNDNPMMAYVSQAWSLQGQLGLLIFIAILLGLGKGGVPGFATVATAATVATSPTNIPGGLGLAVALQVPILAMIDVSAAWLHYRDLDFETILVLLPLSFVGMGIGQWLDERLSDSNARLLVGMFLLVLLTFQVGKDSIMAFVQNGNNKHNKTTVITMTTTAAMEEKDDDAKLLRAESGIIPSQRGGNSDHLTRRQTHSYDSNDPVDTFTAATATNTTNSDIHRSHNLDSSSTTTTHNNNSNKKKKTARSASWRGGDDDDHKSRRRGGKTGTPPVILSRQTKFLWACLVGIVGGVATMLTNAMGPILNVYLLSVVQLSPTAYIGTRAMFFCFLNMGKIPMRFYAGTLAWQMIPLAGFLGLFSVAGVFGAKPIMLSMPESMFVKLELAVVAFSGLRLCWMGLFP